MALYRLIFDTTSTATMTDSANVGAYLRASDGTLIDKTVVATKNHLNVFSALADGAGTALTSTLSGGKQGLDVNILNTLTIDTNGVYNVSTNPTPDSEGLIAHARAATPGVADQTFRSTGGTANASGVVAANVQGLDVNSFLMGYNGTTWDRVTSTSGALNVNISTQSATLTVSDSALANTAILSTATAATTTAVPAPATALTARKYLGIQNRGNRSAFLGASGVTAAAGFELAQGDAQWMRIGPSVSVYAITAAGTADIRTLELS